jgi:hypothetical protein
VVKVREGRLPDPLPARDTRGDPLTYEIVGGALPDRLLLAPDGVFSGTTAESAGRYQVTLDVSDDGGPCVDLTLVLVIERVELPPTDAERPLEVGGQLPARDALLTLAGLLGLAGALLMTSRRRLRISERPSSGADGGAEPSPGP